TVPRRGGRCRWCSGGDMSVWLRLNGSPSRVALTSFARATDSNALRGVQVGGHACDEGRCPGNPLNLSRQFPEGRKVGAERWPFPNQGLAQIVVVHCSGKSALN